jgi:hypothetical protein
MADSQTNSDNKAKKSSEAESPLKAHKPLTPHDSDAEHEDELSAFSQAPSVHAEKAEVIAEELDEAPEEDSIPDEDEISKSEEPIVPSEGKPYASGPAVPTGAMTRGFTRPKRHRLKMVLVVVVFMLLAASAAAYGTYYHYKNDINKPAHVVTQTKIVHETTPAATTPAAAVKLDKLGVQYPFTDTSSDWILLQQHDSQGDFATIGSRKLSSAQLAYVASQKSPAAEAFASCSAERGMLGNIRMYLKSDLPKTTPSGQSVQTQIDAGKSNGTAVDLGDRYVIYTHEQSTCSDDATVTKLQQELSANPSINVLMKSLQLSK